MRLLYRLLLLAYPAAMRDQYGNEMSSVLDEAWRNASLRGWRSRFRFAGRVFADFFRSLPGAWRERPTRTPPPQKDSMTSTTLRELRLAVRVLWQSRWSTAAAVLTLSLAIGATAAVFGVVNAVVFRPLPYADPGRLVTIWENNTVRNNTHNPIAPANFMEWRDRSTSFSAIAPYVDSKVAITGDGPAEQADLTFVAWNLFDVLGVRPALGRSFREDDSAAAAPRKALLSHAFWLRRYHGDPSVIGRSVLMDGDPVEVVGVLPADFRLMGRDADVWWQIRYSAAQRIPRGRSWSAIGRLKPGVTVEHARSEMDTIAAQLQEKWPTFDSGWRVTVMPMKEDMTSGVRLPLLLMFGAVGVVLIAGCASTINLLLARASARRREMAVRSALGATRGAIIRQLFCEGLVLAALGAIGGLAVAGAAFRALAVFAERLGIPRLGDARLSVPVLLFSLAVMAACAIVFSLIPALQTVRAQPAAPLVSGGRWSTTSRSDRRGRQVLVVTQVACAVVLVIAGALITRSLIRLVSVDPGFDPRAYTFSISLPGAKYPKPADAQRFFDETVARLRHTPGVEAAAYMSFLPFKGMGTATSFARPDQPPPPPGQDWVADIRPIDNDYLDVMRVPMLKGRNFTRDEIQSGQKVCIISEAAAKAAFGDDNPIGKWLKIQLVDDSADQVIGVTADLRHSDLRTAPRPMIYYPFGRFPLSFVSVVMRGGLDDASMKAAAVSTVRALDADVPVTDAQRLGDLVSASVASPAAAARVVGAFAVLALVLSLVGVGALLAAIVAGRLSEFGIRMALGATPRQIRQLVLRQGGVLIGAGLAIGLGGGLLVSRALSGVLFEARPLEPAIYVGTLALVSALAFIAADIPARRATKVNPSDSLR
jgi:putative ABC transport system permease protein